MSMIIIFKYVQGKSLWTFVAQGKIFPTFATTGGRSARRFYSLGSIMRFMDYCSSRKEFSACVMFSSGKLFFNLCFIVRFDWRDLRSL
jgi:hypothetical protein